MSIIALKTNNKSVTLDSTINPSKPYLAINYNGVTYKNSLSTQNNGDFLINLNGVTYKTRGNESSTDQLQFNDSGVLTSFTTADGLIYDKTANTLITPSSSVSVLGSHEVVILFAQAYVKYCTSEALSFLTSNLSTFRDNGLIVYEGPLINAPRNYEVSTYGSASVTTRIQVSDTSAPFYTSINYSNLPSVLEPLTYFMFVFNAILGFDRNTFAGDWRNYLAGTQPTSYRSPYLLFLSETPFGIQNETFTISLNKLAVK